MRQAVARASLEQPTPLLAAFLVLSVLAWPGDAAVGGSNFTLPGLLILVFLAWRVSQGGPISRMLLLLASGMRKGERDLRWSDLIPSLLAVSRFHSA